MSETLPRVIPLEGASNFRDLGGYPTPSGQRVRFGRIYRCAGLHGLTDADRALMASLGIREICDFRGDAERQRYPSRPPEGATIHELTIAPTIGASLRDLIANRNATRADVMDVMQAAYGAYATDWHHRYRTFFDIILHTDSAVLFHCTAGKDRTGFGAALLLLALGVEEAHVWEDYLATNRFWAGDSELAASLPPEVGATLLSVNRDFLAAGLAAAGPLEPYLETRLGLTPARLAALRERLLE